MKDYEKIGDHTIKKFELVSEYAKGWAHKILGYSQSAGLIYIDCMCNCGQYYDNNRNIVEGTAIRVARAINQINASHQKEAILHFNDLDKGKIFHLKSVIDMMDLQHVKIYYHSTDANELLRLLVKSDLEKHNTLLFYDPYQADIDWNALEPFFNTWGEVIINHMVSDVIRGAKNVNKPEKIAKYEKTYHKSIDEINKTSNAPNNREEFEKIANSIIESCIYPNSKKYYIASFPFYIKTNQLIYNLIYFSWNVKGMILFKKIAWDIFGGQSSIKHTVASEMPGQMCLDFDTGNIKKDVRPGIYTVYDIAKYIYSKYKDKGEVTWEEIYSDLEKHPIFPCDGYKPKIKMMLKDSFGTVNKRDSVIFENRGIYE